MYVLVRYTKHQEFNQFFWLSTLNSIGCMSGNPLKKKSGCNRLSNLFCKIRRVRAVQRAILRETK